MSEMETFLLPEGYFGPYDQNEVRLVATRDDPVKVRGAVQAKALQGMNLFGESGNIERDDGRLEEYTLIMHRLAPNRVEGAIEIMLREEGREGVVGKVYLDPKGAYFAMPIHAPNLTGGLPTRIALRAVANGRLVCAEGAGGQPLIANRDQIGPWETFEMISL